MSKRKTTRGAGTVPAPRATPEEAARIVAAELRELLGEARGVLSDLVRERKAIEQLARTSGQEVIETHMRAAVTDLEKWLQLQMTESQAMVRESFQKILNSYIGDSPKERLKRRGAPSVPELMNAAEVIQRNQAALQEAQEELKKEVGDG